MQRTQRAGCDGTWQTVFAVCVPLQGHPALSARARTQRQTRIAVSRAGLAPLNLHYEVVLERLKHLAWVKVVQHNFIVPTKRIDRGSALSGAEKVVLAVLEKGREVGTRRQIVAALRAAGYSDSSATMALSRSPIVKPFARAVYTIRARTPSIDALDRAR